MKITFLGAAHEVTGSCTLIEACGKRILVDCGMEQGADIYENYDLPVSPGEIDAVLLTHAHIDHSGKLPAMVANGFNGVIYSTLATHRLCKIMLRDSAHIQESEAEWRNRKAKRTGEELYVPLYTLADAVRTETMFESYGYNESFEVFPNIVVRFIDAGHLLGSSSIHITVNEDGIVRTLLFSGDLGNINRPLIRDPQQPEGADYVIIESTYGDRTHESRPDYVGQLVNIIQSTFDRGGNVVIPSFAVGRTQELLYLIRIIKEKNLIRNHKNFPVFVDSPLAVETTNIYSSGMTDYYDKETLDLLSRGINPILFDGLRLSVTSDESKLINEDPTPKVIISASGMCEAGRIRHHLKHNLWRNDCAVLFVGYQAEGTIGRKLIDGATVVKLFGEDVVVKAHIHQLEGISGHADRNMLTDWLGNMTIHPKKVFVNHGNDEVCDFFAKHIETELGLNAVAPFSGDEYDLANGFCTAKGRIIKVEKHSARKRANAIFERLLAAGKRLMSVINKNKESSNKELARFTDQINALCDKYDR